MNMWEAIVVIVVVTSLARVFRARYRYGAHVFNDQNGNPLPITTAPDEATARDTAALRREIEGLRERVKVLERIATDANSTEGRRPAALAAEIEALRD